MDSPAQDLSSDIRLLGGLLGQVMRRMAGEAAFDLEEEVRAAAKALRASHSDDDAHRLWQRLDQLDLPALRFLIRAFSIYFDLVNLAEQQARVRVLRERARQASPIPTTESIESALRQLRIRGVSAGRLAEHLDQALLCPVFTAHPSEARRRTVLEKIWRITTQLDRLERTNLLPTEQEQTLAGIAEEIEALWLTDLVRINRPTVIDEVRQGLEVVEGALFDVVPRIYRDLEQSLEPRLSGVSRAHARPAALRQLDRRRPRRQSQRDARHHRPGRAPAAGGRAALLPEASRRAGKSVEPQRLVRAALRGP